MIRITKNILLFLLLVTVLEGCDEKKHQDPIPVDEESKLPPASQTGAYTFGCLINGSAFVTQYSHNVFGIYTGGLLTIVANQPKSSFGILIQEQDNNGIWTYTYPLNKYPYSFPQVAYAPLACFYGDSTCYKGQVTLTTFDVSRRIVSGTFEFEAVNEKCDTIKVTKGRFDTIFTN